MKSSTVVKHPAGTDTVTERRVVIPGIRAAFNIVAKRADMRDGKASGEKKAREDFPAIETDML
jgi:hypothetical protein